MVDMTTRIVYVCCVGADVYMHVLICLCVCVCVHVCDECMHL